MEEPSVRADQTASNEGHAGNTSRPSGSIAAADDASNVDEPPIPSASSSKHLIDDKHQSVGESRSIQETNQTPSGNSNHNNNDVTHGTEKGGYPIADTQTGVDDAAHVLPATQVAKGLGTDSVNGLTATEAAKRHDEYGWNKLEASGAVTWWRILIRQVSNSLTLVLAIAMAISFATLDFIEGGVISAVILLNIVVGFFQDYRAEQTIQSLLAMAAPTCRVLRDNGALTTVKAEDLVPGDIVQLSVGDIVPADMRLATSLNLATDEALLTGESKACTKDSEKILSNAEAPLGDRINMVYSSTTVTRGRAVGIVVATGMKTEIGKIAMLLRENKGSDKSQPLYVRAYKRTIHGVKSALGLIGTPLQVKLSWFALFLFALAILLAIIVFSANLWDLDDETLIYGICVAVAVIPESLIAVLTITMAIGSKAMAQGNVVVRKMGALEAIGGVTNICSDKTGTLTQGKMLARKAMLPSGRALKVENEAGPLNPASGHVLCDAEVLAAKAAQADDELRVFFQTIGMCNMSTVSPPKEDEAGSTWSAAGEPTEIALNVMAQRLDFAKADVMSSTGMSLVTEHSFDSSIKRMSVVYSTADEKGLCSFTKGATETLLPLLDISDERRKTILAQVDAMASEGLRVLCLGYRTLPCSDLEAVQDRAFVEQNLSFAGLVGLYDPPRIESASAIKQCQTAGITVHMLTGDHLKTAMTIAKEIGILGGHVPGSSSQTAVMTAIDFDKLDDEALDAMDQLPLVLARCSPTSKLRMLHALHRRGRYCVMTGDGVNDSPALKGADVGVAMGLNGSDVSKEAADMVLTDDNFASIVSAIREGRRLFDNIQKFLLHLLISNISQVILLLIGLAFQDRNSVSSFPLSPIEILWANLITSSFLAIGLGMEEASADVMTRPPHSLKAGVFTRELIVDKMIYGTFMGSLCLASYVIVAYGAGSGDLGADCNESFNATCDLPYRARGTAYASLTVLLSVMAWEAKHLRRSLFNMNPETHNGAFSVVHTVVKNRFLFWAVLAGLLTPFPIIYIPVINREVFRHEMLSWEWGLVFADVVAFVALVEGWKAVKRRFGIGLRQEGVGEAEGLAKSDDSSFVTASIV